MLLLSTVFKYPSFSATTFSIDSCLIPQKQPAEAQAAPTSAGRTYSTVKTAVVGSLLGTAIGKVSQHNALKGAAVGGAVGALACVAINYQRRRRQSAEQVRQAAPPTMSSPQAVVTQFQVQINPSDLSAGQTVGVVTSRDVFCGAQKAVQSLSVRYTLLDTSGKLQQTMSKPVDRVNAAGGGAYQGMLSFTPAHGIPRRTYAFHADLLVNRTVRSSQNTLCRII